MVPVALAIDVVFQPERSPHTPRSPPPIRRHTPQGASKRESLGHSTVTGAGRSTIVRRWSICDRFHAHSSRQTAQKPGLIDLARQLPLLSIRWQVTFTATTEKNLRMGACHARVGINFLGHCIDRSCAWVWWDRGGSSGNRQDFVLRIPCVVHCQPGSWPTRTRLRHGSEA